MGSFSPRFKETRPKSQFTESFSPLPAPLETIAKFVIEKFEKSHISISLTFLNVSRSGQSTQHRKKVAVDQRVLTQDFKFMELHLHCPCPLKQEHQGAKPEGSSSSPLKEIRTTSKWASYLLALRLWSTTNDGEFLLRRKLWTLCQWIKNMRDS